MQAVADSTPTPFTTASTRLSGRWLSIVRAVWIAVTLVNIGLFVASISPNYDEIKIVCVGDATCVPYAAVAPEGVEALDQLGFSLTTWAILVTVLSNILALLFISIGVVVFWRRSNDWMALFVSLWLVLFSVTSLPTTESLVRARPALEPLVVLSQVLGLSSLSILFYLFPNGVFVPRWTRWPALAWIGVAVYLITSTSLISTTTDLLIVMFMGIGALAQIFRYRRVSGPVERQQTKWVIFGSGGFLFALVLIGLPPILFPSYLSPSEAPVSNVADVVFRLGIQPIALILLMSLPLSIALSTLRYRLWDVDPIVNRGIVYGVITALVVITLFVASLLVQSVVGEQQPLVAVGLAVVVSGIAFNSVRNRVQNFVDRHIYGFRFDLNELQAIDRRPQTQNPGALTGITLGGYDVLDVIGQGGMGEVYRGSGKGETVAIKTMLAKIAEDTDMRERFKREVEAGQRLNHPNIARVYASGEHNGAPYLVMEYIEGQTLSDALKQIGKFDEETASYIMKDVAAALDMAHHNGFVHRDLKPSNIMLRDNGTAVLMDFGITKISDASVALTGTGAVGTITYMAPEQIRSSREVDHRADIYALGVMMYEIMTGAPPFVGGAAHVMFAHLQQPPPNPRDGNPDIPRPIAKAILKALEKSPEDRFDSAIDFAAAFV